MRRACLPLLLLSFGTCAPEQDREAYVRARKDGGWDAHCDAAYARLTGAAFSGLDAGVARRGRGVVFSAAGGAEFARREVAPAAAAVAKLRESAAWPGDARVALFAEPAVLRALAAEARGAFDVVQRHDAAAVGLELRGRSPAFRAKALKILAMARAPFEETVYLDFDSKPCAPNFVETILAFLRDGADVALADNYAGQGALAPRDHYQREHASGCVALRSASERTRSLLAAYLEAFLLLEKTPRGRRDQPALMVALRRSVENGLRDAPIPPSVFCRKNTSRTVSCDACVVAHKTAKYDLSFKIFGIGFKKTGTTSLAAALQRLKIGPEPSHRQSVAATVALLRPGEDASLALDAARGARSFSDAPWCMAATRGRLLERLFDVPAREIRPDDAALPGVVAERAELALLLETVERGALRAHAERRVGVGSGSRRGVRARERQGPRVLRRARGRRPAAGAGAVVRDRPGVPLGPALRVRRGLGPLPGGRRGRKDVREERLRNERVRREAPVRGAGRRRPAAVRRAPGESGRRRPAAARGAARGGESARRAAAGARRRVAAGVGLRLCLIARDYLAPLPWGPTPSRSSSKTGGSPRFDPARVAANHMHSSRDEDGSSSRFNGRQNGFSDGCWPSWAS